MAVFSRHVVHISIVFMFFLSNEYLSIGEKYSAPVFGVSVPLLNSSTYLPFTLPIIVSHK